MPLISHAHIVFLFDDIVTISTCVWPQQLAKNLLCMYYRNTNNDTDYNSQNLNIWETPVKCLMQTHISTLTSINFHWYK